MTTKSSSTKLPPELKNLVTLKQFRQYEANYNKMHARRVELVFLAADRRRTNEELLELIGLDAYAEYVSRRNPDSQEQQQARKRRRVKVVNNPTWLLPKDKTKSISRTNEYLVDVTAWPQDFQQLLVEIGLTQQQLIVKKGALTRLYNKLGKTMTDWKSVDYKKAYDIACAVIKEQTMPPLVADKPGGPLIDGYHRLFALNFLEMKNFYFIYKSSNKVTLET